MAKFRVGFRKPNISRVVVKIVGVVLALWVGGEIMTQIGNTMTNTCSPFFTGFSLIGWAVNATNCITATNGTGVLGVIGLIGIASVILEFVKFRM